MPDTTDPPAPLPERGREGAEGEEGTEDQGGAGGHGGRGGRGGIGIQGIQGEQGRRGFRGEKGEGAGDKGEPGPAGAPGAAGESVDRQSKLDKWAIFITVFVCAMSAVWAYHGAGDRLDDANTATVALQKQQAQFHQQIACQQEIVATTIEALRVRSSFSETQARVTLALSKAQREYLDTLVRPGVTRAQQRGAFDTYLRALGFSIRATNDQLNTRVRNPFPSAASVQVCSP